MQVLECPVSKFTYLVDQSLKLGIYTVPYLPLEVFKGRFNFLVDDKLKIVQCRSEVFIIRVPDFIERANEQVAKLLTFTTKVPKSCTKQVCMIVHVLKYQSRSNCSNSHTRNNSCDDKDLGSRSSNGAYGHCETPQEK